MFQKCNRYLLIFILDFMNNFQQKEKSVKHSNEFS